MYGKQLDISWRPKLQRFIIAKLLPLVQSRNALSMHLVQIACRVDIAHCGSKREARMRQLYECIKTASILAPYTRTGIVLHSTRLLSLPLSYGRRYNTVLYHYLTFNVTTRLLSLPLSYGQRYNTVVVFAIVLRSTLQHGCCLCHSLTFNVTTRLLSLPFSYVQRYNTVVVFAILRSTRPVFLCSGLNKSILLMRL